MRRALPLLFAAVAVVACQQSDLATFPHAPALSIQDGAHEAGNSRFFFLPPMVASPQTAGQFDARLAPVVTICHWSGAACNATIATFTMTTGAGSEVIRVSTADEHYLVNWHIDDFGLASGEIYRIQVTVGGLELGHADVQVASNGAGLKNVNTSEFIGLVDGRTLPIKFRIELGIAAEVTVTPSEATLPVGETQGFSATVTDLHGQPLNGLTPVWSSSASGIASVDAGGVATGIAAGAATITASMGGLQGTAELLVTKIAATLAFDFATLSQAYDGTPRSVGVVTTPASLSGVAITYDGSATPPIDAGSYAVLATLENPQYEAAPIGGTLTIAPPGPGVAVSAGGGFSCALATDGTIACWGDNSLNSLTHPGGTFTQVTTGQNHGCGLRSNGNTVCWGYGGNGQTGFQSGPFVQISGGGVHTCGVQTNGAGFCWGGAGPAPSGTLLQISAGGGHTCGVRTDGTVACSGGGTQASPPGGSFEQVSGGWTHTCGVRTDGTVACWGDNAFGQANAPGGTFKQVSAAFRHSCGVRTDDSVACWGWNTSGQATPPAAFAAPAP